LVIYIPPPDGLAKEMPSFPHIYPPKLWCHGCPYQVQHYCADQKSEVFLTQPTWNSSVYDSNNFGKFKLSHIPSVPWLSRT
jgi:hypothetical protein